MDADNVFGPEGAASLASSLERMPLLTWLDLASARIFCGQGLGGLRVGRVFGACCCWWVRALMRCGVVGVCA
jgi:hypothetical protein